MAEEHLTQEKFFSLKESVRRFVPCCGEAYFEALYNVEVFN